MADANRQLIHGLGNGLIALESKMEEHAADADRHGEDGQRLLETE